MKTLNFGDALVENRYTWHNEFFYSTPSSTNLWFSDNSNYRPFILRGGLSDTRNLQFSTHGSQLRSRKLTGPKIEEILDLPRLPLFFRVDGYPYLMGKGWLSEHVTSTGFIKLLFVGCTKGSGEVTTMEDITLLFSKELFTNELYKPFQAIAKRLLASHPGDIMVTRNLNEFVGEKINIPIISNLKVLKQVKEKIVMEVLKDEFPVTLMNG